jgi:serine protease AprX
MARHPELLGQPDRIKRILVDSCTDLARDRGFQGAGLVDVLRGMKLRRGSCWSVRGAG